MGPPGPSGRGGGPPAGRRGAETGPHEPALQGAFGGRGILGELAAQQHADQAGPPGWVRAAEVHGGVRDRLGTRRGGGAAPVVVGGNRGLSLLTEAVEQLPDGARRESQRVGDGGTILPFLEAPPDRLTHRDGGGTRHGPSSDGVSVRPPYPNVCL